MLATYKHNNLVRLHAVCLATAPEMIAVELVDGMNLQEYLNYIRENEEDGTLSFADMLDIISQVADVMGFLSLNNIIHRDLCAR